MANELISSTGLAPAESSNLARSLLGARSNRRKWTKALLVVAAGSTLIFAVVLALAISWKDTPVRLWHAVGFGVVSLGTAYATYLLYCAPAAVGDSHNCTAEECMYLRHQVGVGFALLAAATFCGIVAAGTAQRLLQPGSSGGDPNELCASRLVLAIMMAVLGSLFFVANSLRKLRASGHEKFCPDRFWGGLWFRMGEAVLFTLVLFLFYRAFKLGEGTSGAGAGEDKFLSDFDLKLPVLGLLVGMFIKTGEKLVFGLAERVFAAASVLLPDVPTSPPQTQDEQAPRRMTPPEAADQPPPKPRKVVAGTKR